MVRRQDAECRGTRAGVHWCIVSSFLRYFHRRSRSRYAAKPVDLQPWFTNRLQMDPWLFFFIKAKSSQDSRRFSPWETPITQVFALCLKNILVP
jgi:hypothetical protein